MAMVKLREAAIDGDMNKLYESIRLDPYVLERIDEIPFEDTPVHEAARRGHTNLAIEMMRLKASLGRKLNPDGLSPLDVALQKGRTDTVRRLVKFDSQLIHVQGKEGFTPLHRAVETNKTDLLAEFLVACPQSIEDLTVRGETAVHIAAVMGHVRALEVLLGWVGRTYHEDVLKWKDDKGNTALHLAAHHYTLQLQSTTAPQDPTTIDHRLKVLKLLSKRSVASKRSKNSDGRTAHDIVSGLPNAEEAKKITKPRLALEPPADIKLADILISTENIFQKFFRYKTHLRQTLSDETINAVLVIAVLIITSTYQAALTPPHALYQFGESTNFITPIKYTTTTTTAPSKAYLVNLFPWFLCYNAVAISVAVAIIILIIKDNIYSIMLYISLAALVLSHMIMVTAQTSVLFAIIPFTVYSLIFCFKHHIHLMELMTYSKQQWYRIQRGTHVS